MAIPLVNRFDKYGTLIKACSPIVADVEIIIELAGNSFPMSKLSYMEKLLEGAEVEWKALEDVFNIKNGYTPSKSKPGYWSNGILVLFLHHSHNKKL
jgi:hypothetical protein